jgi:hypothetical protein
MGLDLRQLIINKISELDATGDKSQAVQYFQPYMPEGEKLTRPKLAAWARTGKFPFEFGAAIFDQEYEDVGNTPNPAGEPDPAPTRGYPGNGRDDVVVETEPDPNEVVDESGMTLPPHEFGPMTSRSFGPVTERTPDITKVEGPSTPIPDDIDPVMFTTVAAVLRQYGIIPAGTATAEQLRITGKGPVRRVANKSPYSDTPRRTEPAIRQPTKVVGKDKYGRPILAHTGGTKFKARNWNEAPEIK